jgi:hypothetical protein
VLWAGQGFLEHDRAELTAAGEIDAELVELLACVRVK